MKQKLKKNNKKIFFFKITREDYLSFENLSNDKSLIHSSKNFCKKNNFKDIVVYGGIIAAKLSYVLSKSTNGNKAISASWNINYFKPVYIGEKIKFIIKKYEIYKSKKFVRKEIEVFKKNSLVASITVIQKLLN